MRARSSALVLLLALGCGATTPHVEAPDPPPSTAATPPPPAALLADHGAVVLRSQGAEAQPPFYAELTPDGAITGTRCGASHLSDAGVLEREGAPVARLVPDGDAVTLESADGGALGWRIEGTTLTTRGAAFTLADATITPSDPELPAISVGPAEANARAALALFALLLVCDDVGP